MIALVRRRSARARSVSAVMLPLSRSTSANTGVGAGVDDAQDTEAMKVRGVTIDLVARHRCRAPCSARSSATVPLASAIACAAAGPGGELALELAALVAGPVVDPIG